MYIQVNKEGRERYRRKYFFPNAKESMVHDFVRWDCYDAFCKKVMPGTYSEERCVAAFNCDRLSILCYCPSCGLQFHGSWFYNERFLTYNETTRGRWEPTYFFLHAGITVSESMELAGKERKNYNEHGRLSEIQAEIFKFRLMPNCPLCGGSIIKKEREDSRYCKVSGHNENLDYDFKGLARESQATGVNPIEQSLCVAKGAATVTEFDGDASTISNNVNLLQKYIKHVLDTEATVQLLQRRLSSLHSDAKKYESSYTERETEIRSLVAAAEYEKRTDNPPTIADVKIVDNRPPKPTFSKVKPTEPIFEHVGFFNKKKALAKNDALKAEYERNLQNYKEEMDAYNKALSDWSSADTAFVNAKREALAILLKEYNERKEKERRIFADGLEEKKLGILQAIPDYALYQETMKEIHNTEALLAQAYGCLESLYGSGVIYEKYRDPVALASFYDYFASGRCATLTGSDGAYNLYESEIRMDLVITKLDVVVKKLEDIKKNQYTLYSVMSEMNQNLAELSRTASEMADNVKGIKSSVDTIANNSAVIAHNTAVTAFYAKKNAELTNALGFMLALK